MPTQRTFAELRKVPATALSDHQVRSSDARQGGGFSLELLTSGLVACALAVLVLASAGGAIADSTWRLAGGAAIVLVMIVVVLRLLVFRPISRLAEHSRERLGCELAGDDPRSRNDVGELSHLVDALIEARTADEGKDKGSQSVKDELERVLTINRQLKEVAEMGKEMNAALPYQETVARVLSCAKTFLHADVVALMLLDDEGHVASLEGSQGALSPDSSKASCAASADCPVHQAVGNRSLVRSEGHTCGIVPRTMAHQLVIPVLTESIGDMGLLAAATDGDHINCIPEDVLTALQNHVQSAIASAFKYDAIRRQVATDHLTSLYNRRFFLNRAREEVERSLRHKNPLSVLMIDIDHFKRFNDTHGHSTGDRVLQCIARAMQDALRTSDVCARYGGEEFAVLLPGTSGDVAHFVAERVRRSLHDMRYTGLGLPADVNVTISVGVATCPQDAVSVDDLMELSDEALYRAKDEGRDRVVLADAI